MPNVINYRVKSGKGDGISAMIDAPQDNKSPQDFNYLLS